MEFSMKRQLMYPANLNRATVYVQDWLGVDQRVAEGIIGSLFIEKAAIIDFRVHGHLDLSQLLLAFRWNRIEIEESRVKRGFPKEFPTSDLYRLTEELHKFTQVLREAMIEDPRYKSILDAIANDLSGIIHEPWQFRQLIRESGMEGKYVECDGHLYVVKTRALLLAAMNVYGDREGMVRVLVAAGGLAPAWRQVFQNHANVLGAYFENP